jgi:hypothetical protein
MRINICDLQSVDRFVNVHIFIWVSFAYFLTRKKVRQGIEIDLTLRNEVFCVLMLAEIFEKTGQTIGSNYGS